ncbi:MAG: RNA-dependent RNA polymerase [Guiyang lispivirus 1]|uniref:RNA-directed RNA polymerase L n=1 Tax=Guiyang lispivirus 1 TaxID=2905570 RepID=A0AAX2ZP07_9MONO|nr:MAG: RNA-dependent RNA polymerase [Guiyang lispivirus 1]UHK03027.1 MAG: RNA-dependent RNA polymerase [Guiyang lispivirus 1]
MTTMDPPELDELEDSNKPLPFNPDFHLQSAIRKDSRLLFYNHGINDKIHVSSHIKKAVNAFLKLQIPMENLIIDSENIYNQLWDLKNIDKTNKLNKEYFLALRTAKLILQSNAKILFGEEDSQASIEGLNSYQPSRDILDLNRLRSFWVFLRNNMYKKQISKNYAFSKQKKMYLDIDIYTSSFFCIIIVGGVSYLLGYDQIMMIHDTITSRYLTLLTSELYLQTDFEHIPPPDLVKQIYYWGDKVIAEHGNNGYSIIKVLEPICTGVALDTLDDLKISKEFTKKLIDQYKDTPFENTIKDLYNIIKNSTQNVIQVFEIFGCYRHFGHPTVNEEEGCLSMKKHTRGDWPINSHVVDKITGAFNRCLILNYISKHNRWPGCTCLLPQDHILSKIVNERLLSFEDYNSSILIEDWSQLTFDKEFEFDWFNDFTELLSDKSLSPYLKNWTSVYCKDLIDVESPSFIKESRRVLIEILKRPNFSIKDICEKIMKREIPESWKIVGLHAKERELKIAARLFSMMVLEMRMYFCATEANIAKTVFKYMPGQTMTWSEADLMKHLQTISKLDTKSLTIPIIISLDFEKWNNRWRTESVKGIFRTIDQLWGTLGLLTYTHEFFENSWFYLSSNLNPPGYLRKDPKEPNTNSTTNIELKNTVKSDISDKPLDSDKVQSQKERKQKKLRKESDTTWFGQKGGCEGLRQKGWTAVTLGMLLVAEYITGIKSIITGQGDNQVIVAFIPIRVAGSTPEEYAKEYHHLLDKDIRAFLSVLKEVAQGIGMNIKLEETWVSQHLMNYGKEILVDGVFTTSVFKKISRTFLHVSEGFPCIADRIASIHTSTHSASLKNVDNLIPYMIANIETSILIQYDSLTSATIDSELKDLLIKKNIKLDSELLLFFNILSKDFGGYPIMPFTEYLYRGHPDPLTGYLFWLKQLGEDYAICSDLMKWILSLKGVNPKKDFKMLIQDPTSLNWIKSENGVNVIKLKMENTLSNNTKNKEIKSLLKTKSKKSVDEIIDYLATCRPLSPRVLNDIFRNSPEGARLDFIATFTDMKTMKGLLGPTDSWLLQSKLKKCDINWFEHILNLYITVKKDPVFRTQLKQLLIKYPCLNHIWGCTYQLAKFLRKQSWGEDIYHVTVPHPLEQFQLVYDDEKEELEKHKKRKSEYIVYTILQPKNTLIPERPEFSRGVQDPYYGSNTSEKRSSRLVSFPKTNKALNAAQDLFRSLSWVCSQGSNLSKFLTDLIKSRTNLSFDTLAASSGVCFGGSVAHRFGDVVTKHNSRPNIRGNMFTNIYFSSDTLGKYSRGLENYTMHFQGAFLSALTIISLRASYLGKYWKKKNIVIKQFLNCTNCCELLEDTFIDSENSPPSVRVKLDCPILFASTEDISEKLIWKDLNYITLDYPDLQDPDIIKKRSQAMSFTLLGLSLTNTTPLLHTPLHIPEKLRQNPSVTIGSLIQIGMINILREYSKIWLYDNLIEICRLCLDKQLHILTAVRLLLMKTPKLYWNSLRSLIMLPEIRDTLIKETNIFPTSSEAFIGNSSLDVTLSNIVLMLLKENIMTRNMKIQLYSPSMGFPLQRMILLWINNLAFNASKGDIKQCFVLVKSLHKIYHTCNTTANFNGELFYLEYNKIRDRYPSLPDLNKRSNQLNISKIGAEPWLKINQSPIYTPSLMRLRKPVIPKEKVSLWNYMNKHYNFGLRTDIHIFRQSILPETKVVSYNDSEIKETTFTACYHEHAHKLTGRYSSSHYKYLNIIKCCNIPSIESAICIGEGSGGLTKLLLTLYNIKYLYFNTLFNLKDFLPHRAIGYVPAELLDSYDASIIDGVEDSILYGGNVNDSHIQDMIITKCKNKYINLITMDAEKGGIFTLKETLNLVRSVMNILMNIDGRQMVIFKTYCHQEYTLRVIIGMFLNITDDVRIVVPEWSAEDNSECFLIFEKTRSYKQLCPSTHYTNWLLDNLNENELLQLVLNRKKKKPKTPQISQIEANKLNTMLEKYNFPNNFESVINFLYSGYISAEDFKRNPLYQLAIGMESISYLLHDRLRSYGLLLSNKRLTKMQLILRSQISSEHRDMLRLIEAAFNMFLTILLIKHGKVDMYIFNQGLSLKNKNNVLIFSYDPDLEHWVSLFGRHWNKLKGHLNKIYKTQEFTQVFNQLI